MHSSINKIIPLLFIACTLLAGMFITSASHTLQSSRNQGLAAWHSVMTETERRETISPHLARFVAAASKMESKSNAQEENIRLSALKIQNELTSPTSQSDLDKFQATQSALEAVIAGLMNTSKKYPKLQNNPTFHIFGEQLSSLNARIVQASSSYNTAAQNFNERLSRFPMNLGNALFYHYKSLPEFKQHSHQ